MERMIGRMAEAEGINEQLKASDQLEWVSRMNSIYQRAEEIILNELVFAWIRIAASSGAAFDYFSVPLIDRGSEDHRLRPSWSV